MAMRWTAHIFAASQRQNKCLLEEEKKNHSDLPITLMVFHTDNAAHNKKMPPIKRATVWAGLGGVNPIAHPEI